MIHCWHRSTFLSIRSNRVCNFFFRKWKVWFLNFKHFIYFFWISSFWCNSLFHIWEVNFNWFFNILHFNFCVVYLMASLWNFSLNLLLAHILFINCLFFMPTYKVLLSYFIHVHKLHIKRLSWLFNSKLYDLFFQLTSVLNQRKVLQLLNKNAFVHFMPNITIFLF